jgi:hypothetical protein
MLNQKNGFTEIAGTLPCRLHNQGGRDDLNDRSRQQHGDQQSETEKDQALFLQAPGAYHVSEEAFGHFACLYDLIAKLDREERKIPVF